jgi:uncharacterized protein
MWFRPLALCLVALCGGVAVSGTAAAENGSHDGWEYFRPVQTHLIRSKYVKQTFKVQVMDPARKRGERVRFPVVYATDGNLAFDALKGISYSIQRSAAPRFILVGIGYPGDSPLAGELLRARDLTFPGHPYGRIEHLPIEDVARVEEGSKDFFGAEDFQRFISEELIPFIDGRYDTLAGDRTYYGHSGGGGFGLYTLFTRPELFKNYIISSPNVVFNGEAPGGERYDNYDFLLRDARKFVESGKRLPAIRLYMSVGTAEEFEPGLDRWQLTSGFYRMAAILNGPAVPGLDLMTETLEGETHLTVWPLAFIHGVQAVYGTGAWRRPTPRPAGE